MLLIYFAALLISISIVLHVRFPNSSYTVHESIRATSRRLSENVHSGALPPGIVNQSPSEGEHLKLHKCLEAGEAYSAAYLTTREHILYHFTDYNLTWVNCEMASFIMISSYRNKHVEKNGTILQSLDVLDFSVIHLSAFERLQRRHAKFTSSFGQPESPLQNSTDLLKSISAKLRAERDAQLTALVAEGDQSKLKSSSLYKRSRTVAVMPFLASDMGSGHSVLSNRLLYLHSCFWSVYAEFPHVVVAVKSQKDYDFAKYVLSPFCVFTIMIIITMIFVSGIKQVFPFMM